MKILQASPSQWGFFLFNPPNPFTFKNLKYAQTFSFSKHHPTNLKAEARGTFY
ncbi:hypothetical protein [Belliella buryatensis]|uniref:hypothetical protein n=1 Tax=Belliella buryatensis TaxID=1500549 RepID=UPI001BAF45DB|nr:hypothetical protein [Belliella buryatensis]